MPAVELFVAVIAHARLHGGLYKLQDAVKAAIRTEEALIGVSRGAAVPEAAAATATRKPLSRQHKMSISETQKKRWKATRQLPKAAAPASPGSGRKKVEPVPVSVSQSRQRGRQAAPPAPPELQPQSAPVTDRKLARVATAE